jgi:site-specific DNA-methyltransferase (adenine-specific)
VTAIDLRLGNWRDVLADVECDALITDPPYSAITHENQRTGSSLRVSTITYEALTEEMAFEIARAWSVRTRWWAVIFCDLVAFQWHQSAWREQGWIVFTPVFLRENPRPRFSGDGPTAALEFMCAARRRGKERKSGSLPGYYSAMCGTDDRADRNLVNMAGVKPMTLMRSIVEDYTLPGDLICDPHAGSGTTLIAAAIEGRRGVGSERDPKTFAKAQRRIAKGYTPRLQFGELSGDQQPMFTEEP